MPKLEEVTVDFGEHFQMCLRQPAGIPMKRLSPPPPSLLLLRLVSLEARRIGQSSVKGLAGPPCRVEDSVSSLCGSGRTYSWGAMPDKRFTG